MRTHRLVWDTSRFPGFWPTPTVVGFFGDPKVRVIRLQRRRKKTACEACGLIHRTWYDRKSRRVRDLPCGDMRTYPTLEIRRVDYRRCGTVKQETLDWLLDNPFDTTRCSFFVDPRCQTMPVKDVAQETPRAWWTIRDLEKETGSGVFSQPERLTLGKRCPMHAVRVSQRPPISPSRLPFPFA